MIYVVAYELNPPRPIDEKQVIGEIQGSAGWVYAGISNVWFVASPEDISSLFNRLRARLSPSDSILVTEITYSVQESFWGPRNAVEWFNEAQAKGWERP